MATKEELQRLEENCTKIEQSFNHEPIKILPSKRARMVLTTAVNKINSRISFAEWDHKQEINRLKEEQRRINVIDDCLRDGGYYMLVDQHDKVLTPIIASGFTAFEEIVPEVIISMPLLLRVGSYLPCIEGYHIYEVKPNGVIEYLGGQFDTSD